MEYTGQPFYKTSITGKTQADGAVTLDVSDSLFLGIAGKSNWAIQFVVEGTPTAGTVQVAVKLPGAPEFADVNDPVDLVNGPLLVGVDKPAAAFRFTPSGFDGDSYSVYLCAV